jgi:hypothetical protein
MTARRRRTASTSGRKSKRKNAKSTANQISSFLLGVNKVVRDLNALDKGTVGARIERRLTGKAAGQALGANFLKFFQK